MLAPELHLELHAARPRDAQTGSRCAWHNRGNPRPHGGGRPLYFAALGGQEGRCGKKREPKGAQLSVKCCLGNTRDFSPEISRRGAETPGILGFLIRVLE